MKYSKNIIVLLFLFLTNFNGAQSFIEFKKLYDSVYDKIRSDNRSGTLEIFDELFLLSQKHNSDSLQFVTYEQFALYYFIEGDYTKSAENLVKALDYANKLPDETSYWDTKNNLALIYSKLDEIEKAKAIYLEIYNNSSEKASSDSYISTISNLGSVYQDLNKLDSSKYYLRKAIKLSKDNRLNSLIASNLKFLSKNHLLSKEYDSSIVVLDELKNIYWKDLSPRQKDDAMYTSAQAYYHIGNLKKAQKDLEYSFELMKVTKKDPAWLKRLEFQSEILEAQKDYKMALKVQKQVLRLRDSFDSATRSSKVLEIEEKYQSEKKEKENLKLKQEAAEKDLNIANKNNFILISFLLFSLVIVSLISYQLKKFRDKNLALRQSIEKREQLENELEIVRDNIAKDFHDDLGNKLARISALSDLMIVSSENRSKDDIVKALKNIKEDSNILYSGTRDFMFSLKSKSDYLEETITYLSDFGQDFFDALYIDFFVSKSIQENIKLPYYWNRQIIMIFKEAMTNIAKHSEAKRVDLKINQIRDVLEISLQDDGKGFDVSSVPKNNGIKNMKVRAGRINCLLWVESSSNGSLVSFKSEVS